MATKAQKIRLGLFLLTSTVALGLFLILIAGSHLTEQRHFYYIEFKGTSVTGLTQGAQVRYQGIPVGRVEKIFVSPEDVTTIVVEISVDPELVPNAIRVDTQAALSSVGITGLKYIGLIAGSQYTGLLPPGSRIRASDTFMANIDQRAEILTDKLEGLIDNLAALTSPENQTQFNRLLTRASDLMDHTSGLVEENRASVRQTVENLALATQSLQGTMDSLNQVLAGKSMRSAVANLQAATQQMRRQLEGPLPALIDNLNRTAGNIDTTFTHIDLTVLQSRKNILDVMRDLNEVLQNMREATELIREDPSVLIRGRGEE